MNKKFIDLNETGYLIHRTSKDKGFYDVDAIDVNFVLSKIALLHSECTEVLEAVRKDQGQEKLWTSWLTLQFACLIWLRL